MAYQQPVNTHKTMFIALFAIAFLLFAGGLVFMVAWPLALYNASNQKLAPEKESLMPQTSPEVIAAIKDAKLAEKAEFESRQTQNTSSASSAPQTKNSSPATSTAPSSNNTAPKNNTAVSNVNNDAPKTEAVATNNQAKPKYLSGTKLKIPASATVFTLSGLNFNLYNSQPEKLKGIFKESSYKLVKVNYPASLASNSISKGVQMLDKLLKSTPGQKIVLAHSQGAQVASRWMREHANDPNAPAASTVTFILTGNPLRSTGGYIIGRKEVGGTTGQATPTNTKWPIIDIARRYDGWADWVKDTNNDWAVKNANAGKNSYHMQYEDVDVRDPSHTIWAKGNTTYVLTKEDVLPMWKSYMMPPASVVSSMKAHIESAYDRPSNDPKVKVIPTKDWFWNTVMKVWGIDRRR